MVRTIEQIKAGMSQEQRTAVDRRTAELIRQVEDDLIVSNVPVQEPSSPGDDHR